MMPFGQKIRNTKQIRKSKQLKLQTTAKTFVIVVFLVTSAPAVSPVSWRSAPELHRYCPFTPLFPGAERLKMRNTAGAMLQGDSRIFTNCWAHHT